MAYYSYLNYVRAWCVSFISEYRYVLEDDVHPFGHMPLCEPVSSDGSILWRVCPNKLLELRHVGLTTERLIKHAYNGRYIEEKDASVDGGKELFMFALKDYSPDKLPAALDFFSQKIKEEEPSYSVEEDEGGWSGCDFNCHPFPESRPFNDRKEEIPINCYYTDDSGLETEVELDPEMCCAEIDRYVSPPVGEVLIGSALRGAAIAILPLIVKHSAIAMGISSTRATQAEMVLNVSLLIATGSYLGAIASLSTQATLQLLGVSSSTGRLAGNAVAFFINSGSHITNPLAIASSAVNFLAAKAAVYLETRVAERCI